MKSIANRFLANYVLMFFISTLIACLAFLLTGFASDLISKTLVKNQYTAQSLMQDDYASIDTKSVISNGGGVQVINRDLEIVFSEGLNTFQTKKLTTHEFTEFLINSKKVGVTYSYSVLYNTNKQFWLIVTFPTSIRIDFSIAHNSDYPSMDIKNTTNVIAAVIIFYLLLLAGCTVIYSKMTSIGIVAPLRKLMKGAQRFKDGDYSTRVHLNLNNEFNELQGAFNSMAEKIEHEISLRKQMEESRKRLILDISHDLKNPLASIMGYSELLLDSDLTHEQTHFYAKVIYDNTVRANMLIVDLFELSKMESPEYKIMNNRVDICEYTRQKMSEAIPIFEENGFDYAFEIPEDELFISIDTRQMDRVYQNLTVNAVRYNPSGTKIVIRVSEEDGNIIIVFQDDGIGMRPEVAEDIFKPFVRVDDARNSLTGGSGLGLAIVEKIIIAHGGNITLTTDVNKGCTFTITIPKV